MKGVYCFNIIKRWLFLLLLIGGYTGAVAQNSWVNVAIQSDQYGSETSWVIVSSVDGSVVGESGIILGDALTQEMVSLPAGPYEFIIYDSFGDGICCSFGEGWIGLSNACGLEEYIYDFNTPSLSVPFVLESCPLPLYGCMDSDALNYNPWATQPTACTLPPQPCPLGQANIVALVTPDSYPGETSWSMSSNGTVVLFGSGYTETGVAVPSNVCASVNDTIVVSVYDSYGDGLCGSCWGGVDGSVEVFTLCGDSIFSAGGVQEFDTVSSGQFIVPVCLPPVASGCTDPEFLEYDALAVIDDGSCVTTTVLGCTDSLMYNYSPEANVMELEPSCEYILTLTDGGADGWFGSWIGLEQSGFIFGPFHMGPEDGYEKAIELTLSSNEIANIFFFTQGNSATTAAQCGFKLEGPDGMIVDGGTNPWTDPIKKFPYKYQGMVTCQNYCTEFVYGCTDPFAQNFYVAANAEDASCYYASGCTQAGYLEYYTQGYVADFDDGTCDTLAVFGCLDSSAFNYDALANVDNEGCLPVIEGCMNSLAFNYDPLANTDAECIPFIYGCTDPTAFNYDIEANTNNEECVDVVLGCTDSTALNYNPLANTDNDGCVLPVEGCMDPDAWNYDFEANVPDLEDCLYDAGCVTGAGNPYWLNDSCYAWVIEVDPYCCESVWDGGCMGLYDYCNAAWPTSVEELDNQIVIHPNPTLGVLRIETNLAYTFSVYHPLGFVVVDRSTDRVVDLSKWPSGAYHMILESNGAIYRKTIIKQ